MTGPRGGTVLTVHKAVTAYANAERRFGMRGRKAPNANDAGNGRIVGLSECDPNPVHVRIPLDGLVDIPPESIIIGIRTHTAP